MKKLSFFLFLLTFAACVFAAEKIQLDKIKLPKGFHIQLFTDQIPRARAMCYSPSGVLYVGSWNGNVYAVVDADKDWKPDSVTVVASGLDMPVGVDFYKGDLYISSHSKIVKLPGIEKDLDHPPLPVTVYDALPKDMAHGWKFIRFGPDGWLYVPIGAPYNIGISKNPVYATIARMTPDGKNFEIFAYGIRNTVGFDWDPATGELWFTENGRDWLGDNAPPDELNKAPVKGLHFGYPYLHGKSIPDPIYGKQAPDMKFTLPEQELGAHVAALGMRFYTGKMFPEEYYNQIFIAEHGSWNSSVPIGYRITLVRIVNGKAAGYEVFAEGWLQKDGVWGRPADVVVAPDGSLLVSDDKAGAVYRIYYDGK